MAGGKRWQCFFNSMCPLKLTGHASMDESFVFNFLRSFTPPYGVQHGDDEQVIYWPLSIPARLRGPC